VYKAEGRSFAAPALDAAALRVSVDEDGSLILPPRLRAKQKMGNRIFVGNLGFDTTDETLREAFSEFGEVTESKVIVDRDSGRSRGFAFVMMATNEQAQKAIAQMDGRTLDGRQLRVNEAEERKPRPGGGGGGFGGRKSGGSRRGGGGDRW
jgi:RNA recognition motif-containing protein